MLSFLHRNGIPGHNGFEIALAESRNLDVARWAITNLPKQNLNDFLVSTLLYFPIDMLREIEVILGNRNWVRDLDQDRLTRNTTLSSDLNVLKYVSERGSLHFPRYMCAADYALRKKRKNNRASPLPMFLYLNREQDIPYELEVAVELASLNAHEDVLRHLYTRRGAEEYLRVFSCASAVSLRLCLEKNFSPLLNVISFEEEVMEILLTRFPNELGKIPDCFVRFGDDISLSTLRRLLAIGFRHFDKAKCLCAVISSRSHLALERVKFLFEEAKVSQSDSVKRQLTMVRYQKNMRRDVRDYLIERGVITQQ
jgi:hypothetical protein